MAKYIIEGSDDAFDFYQELYKSFDDVENLEGESQENLCLITGEKLSDKHVTMLCNHKFNYIPLLNDLINYKKKYNHMEAQCVKPHEIRCPYCRNRQSILLPYYEGIGIQKIQGVNFWDPALDTNSAKKDSSIIGTCSWESCNWTNVYLHPGDNKTYCYYHHKKVGTKLKSQQKIALKLKEKEEAVALKLKAKEEAAALKLKLKEEKNSLKKSPVKKMQKENKEPNENLIISNNQCHQILKTGIRSGQMCGAKICITEHGNSYCLRHAKMNNLVSNVSIEENIK